MDPNDLKEGDFVRYEKNGVTNGYFGYVMHTSISTITGQLGVRVFDPSCTSKGDKDVHKGVKGIRWSTHMPGHLVKAEPPADYPPMPGTGGGEASFSVTITKPKHVAGLSPEKVDWDKVMKGGWTE